MPLRGGTCSDCDLPSVFTQAVYRGPLRTHLLGQSGQTAYRDFPAFAHGKLNTTTREPSSSRGAPLHQGLEGGLPRVRPASCRGVQGRPAREHASPRPGLGEPYTSTSAPVLATEPQHTLAKEKTPPLPSLASSRFEQLLFENLESLKFLYTEIEFLKFDQRICNVNTRRFDVGPTAPQGRATNIPKHTIVMSSSPAPEAVRFVFKPREAKDPDRPIEELPEGLRGLSNQRVPREQS